MLQLKISITKRLVIIMVMIFTMMSSITASAYTMKQAPLMTQWASQVDPANPLPEYPRPQLVRSSWQSLNGVWQFQSGTPNDPVPVGKTLTKDILVPYPIESAISGVMAHYDRVWYRRTFTVPSTWSGQRIMLNFGAVDWESEVFINGKSVGVHRGGYDSFSYDITSYLVGTGDQELIVRIFDPTENGGQPRGKQAISGISIMYTPTTGIWQSVWLEPIPQTGISNIKIVPNIDNSTVKLTVNTVGPDSGVTVSVQVKDADTVVQTVSDNPNTEMIIKVPDPKLWTPDNPFLYDLAISLEQKGAAVDSVTSYFGMRKISIGMVDGYQKILLNNKFVFQLGVLDQGYWPDGNYTAPTDAALAYDLQQEKAMGMNMVRKHNKIEPQRWYYWADKLGLMVWQDMPSAESYGGVHPDPAEFQTELTAMVQTHWNSPSIIMWDVYNERCGQDFIEKTISTATLVKNVKTLDPSRLVNQASGYNWHGVGNVADNHSYPIPAASPGTPDQAIACGEFGGIGYQISEHTWSRNSSTYGNVGSESDYLSTYDCYAAYLCALKKSGLSGAVYTQTTDVESELNGIITYDRAVIKGDINQLKASNLRAINQTATMTDVLAGLKTWKYTTTTPDSEWYATSFDDQSWSSGQAGFGTTANAHTKWDTADIWMRQTFHPGVLKDTDISSLIFKVFHADDCEIYINGVLAASETGRNSNYDIGPINQAGKSALISNEKNVIAIHCHHKAENQYIDAGISKFTFSGEDPSP